MSRKRRTPKAPADPVGLHGFFRVQLVNAGDGRIEGDTGWKQNVITSIGSRSYVIGVIGGAANSSRPGYLAVATQTAAPTSDSTSLTGEQTRKQLTSSLSSNGTLQMTASWATNEANTTIGTIGVYATDSGGSLAAAQSFTASTKTSDQVLNATYNWTFA